MIPRTRQRLNTRTSASKSASSADTHKTPAKKAPQQTTEQTEQEFLESESLDNAGFVTNSPSPIYQPYIAPGVKGQVGSTMYMGNLSPDRSAQPNNHHRFIFHWNPPSIDQDVSTSYSAAVQPLPKYTAGGRLLFVQLSTMSFQFMIERQDEVANNTPLGHGVYLEYGSNRFNGVKATGFREVGTLFDLDVLYRAINGNNRINAVNGTKFASAISVPYLFANPMFCTFGTSFQYYGYVTDLSTNHIMFSAGMVPTVTYVQLTMNAISLKNTQLDTSSSAATSSSSGKNLTVKEFDKGNLPVGISRDNFNKLTGQNS